MKYPMFAVFIAIVLLCACSKDKPLTPGDTTLIKTESENNYIKYCIFKGLHYSNKNGIVPVKTSNLAFKVRFDSSAIYSTLDPDNQTDINKLFGFSDNKATHQEYSARFGWRWSDNALRIFAYTYNDGTRRFKEIGTVEPGKENDCSIEISGDTYTFTLNETKLTMPRESLTIDADGYKLFPYFGGDEAAPHDIIIWMKEVKTPEVNH